VNLKEALIAFNEFKGTSLQKTLKELETVDNDTSSNDFKAVYTAAGVIKKASAQVDEVVHASGIMLAKSVWLKKNERVTYLSLGAGNHPEKFDMVTNLRIAEFKFGKWNDSSANGQRRRSYFGNYINLLTAKNTRERYFVVEDKIAVEKFLKGKSLWRNVLRRNWSGIAKVEQFLQTNGLENLKTVGEIYRIKKPVVSIVSFNEIVNNT
jgi:hypothetical protein